MTDRKIHGTIDESKFEKYIKIPVIIEAYQTHTGLEIETLEGLMKANKNDWIIKGVKGELYPCSPEVFKKTYTECEDNNSRGEFRKFIKKPVEVDAYQTRIALDIPTKRGVMKADKNDWIIRGISGECYPCKPDVFQLTYKKKE